MWMPIRDRGSKGFFCWNLPMVWITLLGDSQQAMAAIKNSTHQCMCSNEISGLPVSLSSASTIDLKNGSNEIMDVPAGFNSASGSDESNSTGMAPRILREDSGRSLGATDASNVSDSVNVEAPTNATDFDSPYTNCTDDPANYSCSSSTVTASPEANTIVSSDINASTMPASPQATPISSRDSNASVVVTVTPASTPSPSPNSSPAPVLSPTPTRQFTPTTPSPSDPGPSSIPGNETESEMQIAEVLVCPSIQYCVIVPIAADTSETSTNAPELTTSVAEVSISTSNDAAPEKTAAANVVASTSVPVTSEETSTSLVTTSTSANVHVVQGALVLNISLPHSSAVSSLVANSDFNTSLAQAVAAGMGSHISAADVTISSINVVDGGERRRLRGTRRMLQTTALEISYLVTLADAAAASDLVLVLSTSEGKSLFINRFTEVLQSEAGVTVHGVEVMNPALLQDVSAIASNDLATTSEAPEEDSANKTVLIAGGLCCIVFICVFWQVLRIKWANYRVFSSIVPGEERKVDLNKRAAKRIEELKAIEASKTGG